MNSGAFVEGEPPVNDEALPLDTPAPAMRRSDYTSLEELMRRLPGHWRRYRPRSRPGEIVASTGGRDRTAHLCHLPARTRPTFASQQPGQQNQQPAARTSSQQSRTSSQQSRTSSQDTHFARTPTFGRPARRRPEPAARRPEPAARTPTFGAAACRNQPVRARTSQQQPEPARTPSSQNQPGHPLLEDQPGDDQNQQPGHSLLGQLRAGTASN